MKKKMRKKIVGILVCTLLMASIAVFPMTETVQSSNGDDPTPPTPLYDLMHEQPPDPNGTDVSATETSIMAVDFPCTELGRIVGFYLCGSWRNDTVGTIDNIHFSIHEDIPDPDGDGPLYSKPGEAYPWRYETGGPITHVRQEVWPGQAWYDPSIPEWYEDNHDFAYRYEIFMDYEDGFDQVPGKIYWVDVQVTTTGGTWGWKTCTERWQDDAVWGEWDEDAGDDPNEIEWMELRHPITDESLDMGFGVFIEKELQPEDLFNPDISPGTVNTDSQGNTVTVSITVTGDYSPGDVVIGTLELGPEYSQGKETIQVYRGCATGIKKVLAKFDRGDLEDMLYPGTHTMQLSWQFTDGTPVQVECTLKVIDPGKK
ncbi:MAG: hypothetical protein JSV56_02720 [Methanomassiliicoccales archaeon]|nr:MAG: hypothetical protein JSV56_02720 [Methanomassiliicoccales archaeon]